MLLKQPWLHRCNNFFFFFFFFCLWRFFPVRTEYEGSAAFWVVGTLGVPSVREHRLSLMQELWPYQSLFFLVSCTWRSEGLCYLSFSMALPIQALRRLPCLGSFSVVQCIRHIEGSPLAGVLLCSSVHQAFDGPVSLLFSCRCVGRERLW